jgi:DNA-binding CsgD family transcriptional regulator
VPAINEHWAEAWAEAVGGSALAMGLLDPESARFLALSPSAADLLGTTPEVGVGLDYLDMVEERADARRVHRLLRSGALDGAQVRRRLRRVDGRSIEVLISARTIRHHCAPDLALWIAVGVPGDTDHAVAEVGRADHVDWRDLATIDSRTATATGPWRIPALGELQAPDVTVRCIERIVRESRDAVPNPVGEPSDDGDGEARALDPWAVLASTTADLADDFAAAIGEQVRRSMLLFANALDHAQRGSVERDAVEAFGRRRPSVGVDPAMRHPEVVRAARAEANSAGLGPSSTVEELPPGTGPDRLTERELEILQLLAEGLSGRAIAARLYLSPHTVRNHVQRIIQKLNVHSRLEAVALAVRHDLVGRDQP